MKCLHTFCKHCLENHAKRSDAGDAHGWECPRCKQFTALSDVTACTRTEQLLALYERGTKRKMCFQCDTETAEWKCKDCEDFYCKTCKIDHGRIKKFRGHEWSNISEVQEDYVRDKNIICNEHADNQVEFYCFDCEALLCSLCLLKADHGRHNRETIEVAAAVVRSNVVAKLAAVSQIANERFVRSEKLKETRLLVQTFSDNFSEELDARYEFLKQKLDDDYHTLKASLQKSTDDEMTKINTSIKVEESKQSHADAVTSYIETTLATTGDALMIQESNNSLLPTIASFCEVQENIEPLVTSQLQRFKPSVRITDDENILGAAEKLPADFHSRFQPSSLEKVEDASLGKTIDISIGNTAKAYRINLGFGRIVVCLWSIGQLHIYNLDGELYKVMNLDDEVIHPWSAAFVSNDGIALAANEGLFIVDLDTAVVVQTVNKDTHADVFYHGNSLYALNDAKKQVEIVSKENNTWQVASTVRLPVRKIVQSSATLVMTPRMINVCNYNDAVLQYSFDGALLHTVTVNTHQSAAKDRFICAADVDGRMALSVGKQLVIQHNDDSRVIKLEGGVTQFQDIVFEDQHTFWILDCISRNQGKYRIVKYNI